MITTKLEVVNDCLALLGELPLNTLDDDHGMVQAALRSLTRANRREQAKSWWFNQEQTVLTPDSSTKEILLPSDTIRVDPLDGSHYVARGRRLYNQFASNAVSKYQFSGPVTCKLLRLVAFEDLPLSAQLLVSVSAQLDFGKNYDADRTRTEELKLEYRDAFITLNTEHIRNRDVNLLNRPSMQRDLQRIGYFSTRIR